MESIFEKFYECTGVSTDTRSIKKDNLFIALKGENFNGNEYADIALDEGAKYAVVSDVSQKDHQNKYFVEDTLLFLQKLGNYHRRKMGTKVIGITGSNGKTTSKELINCVLAQKYNVLCTAGNLNNHIGVPLTILKLTKEHDLAIIEMGANKPGDIKELSDICEPDVGVITNIGKAHLEGFGGVEGVVKTKTELYRFLAKNKGLIFHNQDDQRLIDNLPEASPTYTYGKSNEAYLQGDLVRLKPEVVFSYKFKGYDSGEIETQIIGEYNFYNLLLAACVGTYFGVDFDNINKALRFYNPKNNRSQVEKTEKGNTLILDAYNANPTSVSAALKSFGQTEAKNKFVILGDMLELGEDSYTEHENIVSLVNELGLKAFFVGPLYSQVKEMNNVFFEDKHKAKTYFESNKLQGNLVLLKGSRAIGLETLKDLF